MHANFIHAHLSDRGGRPLNEDFALVARKGDTFCWAVADGLGGHRGGDAASRIACEAVIASFQSDSEPSPRAMMGHIRKAERALRRAQAAMPALLRMRTTIAVLLADATHAVAGHVGDTRLYHFRRGALIYQTRDHSVPQSLVDAGKLSSSAIRHHADRHCLLRALGEEPPCQPAILSIGVAQGQADAFLLCTDGLWDKVLETEMESDLVRSRCPAEWLSRMERRLKERTERSHDNYTAVAVLAGNAAPLRLSRSL